ncbi:MAG: hypothetical protein PHU04_05625 [Candidatus Peribacteraceae bacterium]|nr:hypothetical protein [Candidatus Peribacteraceae bacterium]
MSIIDDLKAAGIEAPEFDTLRGRIDAAVYGLAAPGYWSDAFDALALLAIGYKSQRDLTRGIGAQIAGELRDERDAAIAERDLAHAHILQLETERDELRRQLGD